MDLHLFDLNLLVALDALLTERDVTRAGNTSIGHLLIGDGTSNRAWLIVGYR